MIAGSNPPVLTSYSSSFRSSISFTADDLLNNCKIHCEQLLRGGVDFILHETQGHRDEILLNARYCDENKIPFIISFIVDKEGKLLDGHPIELMIEEILPYKPLAVGFNCIMFNVMDVILKKVDLKSLVWGFYLNCGDEEQMKMYKFGQSNQLDENSHQLNPA